MNPLSPRWCAGVSFVCICWATQLAAQGRFYVGGGGGLSTLSGDAQSQLTPTMTAVSLYKPENGPLVTAFAGLHLLDYLSVQASYTWNRNDLTFTSAAGDLAYQEKRSSTQQAFSVNLVGYFRNRRSRVRPWLAVGTGLVRLSSRRQQIILTRGTLSLPPAKFFATDPILHVPVGADVRLGRRWWLRYSFSETIGSNAISRQLSPPGRRKLKNFQNVFGIFVTP